MIRTDNEQWNKPDYHVTLPLATKIELPVLLYDSLIASQYPCVDYPTDQLSIALSPESNQVRITCSSPLTKPFLALK